MGFLIGELSPNQYHTYLSASSRVEAEKMKGVAAFFKFSSYPALAVLINRLAYFILNCFKAYPNDAYLFEKFKSHQFTAMKSVEEYQAAKEIFKRFQKCPELKAEDVAQVKQDLKDLKKIVSPKPISHTPEPTVEGIDQRKEDQIEKEHDQEKPVKTSVDTHLREENSNIEQEKNKTVADREKEASVEENSAETKQKKDEDSVEGSDSEASSVKSSAKVELEVREDTIENENSNSNTSTIVSKASTKKVEEEVGEEGNDEWTEDEEAYQKNQQRLALLEAESDKKEIESAAHIDAGSEADRVQGDAKGPGNADVGAETGEKADHVEGEIEGSGDTEAEEEIEVVEEELKSEENAGTEAGSKEEIEEELPQVKEVLSPHIEAVKLYVQEDKTAEEFVAAMQTLENEMTRLPIVQKFQDYQTAKEEHEVKESQKWFYDKKIPFNDVAYSVPHTDIDAVISKAETLLKYSVKARHLELTEQQMKEFNHSFNAIRNDLIHIQEWLKVVNRDTKETNYTDKKQHLQLILTTLAAEVGIVIGENAEKSIAYPEWKISRYETLISGTKTNIVNYFNKLGFDIEILALKSLDTQPDDWLVQLKPILLFCRQTVRKDKERFDKSYAEDLSQTYVTFIGNLRKAEEWAANHPKEVGAQHIHALCYQFYVMLEMNQECQEIVDTFVKKAPTQNIPNNDILTKYKLLSDEKYKLLQGIDQIRYSIQHAPEEVTSPRLMNRSTTFIKDAISSPTRGLQQLTRAASATRVVDNNTQSNFANLILQKILTVAGQGQKHVKELGMGAPIIESGFTKTFSNTVVNSEFKGFLKHCQRNGLKHLYVSTLTEKNSNYHPAIQKLEEEFKGVFFALKLSQDSAFYEQRTRYQIGDYDITLVKERLKDDLLQDRESTLSTLKHAALTDPNKMKDAISIDRSDSKNLDKLRALMETVINPLYLAKGEQKTFKGDEEREDFIRCFYRRLRVELQKPDTIRLVGQVKLYYSIYDTLALFKQELVDQMFSGSSETGNSISQGLVTQFNLRAWSTTMVEQIHQKMFGGKDNLSAEERRIFIRLFYQNLMQKVLLETGVDSYNISCEKGCDQAAATQAEEFAYLAILNNCANDPEVIKTFETNLFARAVIVNKSSIDEGCLERTIETVKFMLDHQDQLKALHAELFPNVQMTTDQFPVEEIEEVEEVAS